MTGVSPRWSKPALAALCAFAVSCSGSVDDSTAPTLGMPSGVVSSSTPVGSTSTVARSPVVVWALGTPVDLGDLADAEPVDLAVRPGAEPASFLVLRTGLVVRLDDDMRPVDTVLDITDLTRAEGERGLLGLAFAPDVDRAFVNYTDLDGDTRIVSYAVDANGVFDESSSVEVYDVAQPYPNHNGGELLVDAVRSRLLLLTGDGGAGGDPERVALDPASPLGKVIALPLDPDGAVGEPTIVAVGLRNPWRASIFEDTLWIADVGQSQWEEVNSVSLGALDSSSPVSFGWSALEGSRDFNADQLDAHSDFVGIDPVFEYEHRNGRCSISGGAVAADASPVGSWFVYADFCTGEVMATCVDACGATVIGRVPGATAVLPDHRGHLWVLGIEGALVPILTESATD